MRKKIVYIYTIFLMLYGMQKEQFLENISRIQELFQEDEKHFNALSQGISHSGEYRDILDDFLDALNLPKTQETYYTVAARLGDKKFEPLEIYLEKHGYTREEIDNFFESSYLYVSNYYEKRQEKMLEKIHTEMLLPEFYMTIFSYTHILGKLYSKLFLVWNRKLLFGVNRELEKKYNNDQDAIIAYLEKENLFDRGHHGEKADRSYSILIPNADEYVSRAYRDVFPQEVNEIIALYDSFITELSQYTDLTFKREQAYREYFEAVRDAWKEQDVDKLVACWSEVDVKWMAIDTPVQPGHPIEYYEDKYRRAVSIEFDMRLVDPSLFRSEVAQSVEAMYEGLYSEIGKENFPESYEYSLNNQKQVQLYIGAPVLAYGSFLCGAYSAQVVPNDDEVSKIHGKKIFAFPKFVLESQRSAPKMKLDQEMISSEILEKYYDFLNGPDEGYYKIYDIETIGHEYGHTLWLTPGCEVRMGESGLYKNIEEFKATAGGLVSYFYGGGDEKIDKDIVVTNLMRAIKIMRYREVEDILPYYCECLIHLHILFESGILAYENGKVEMYFTDENYTVLRELYMAVYTQLIFTYLHQMDAGNFLFEFTVREKGIFLPKDKKVREFVEDYYSLYKEVGNEVV